MTLYVITGANGFIGRHLVTNLVADQQRVRALTRKHSGEEWANSTVEWTVGDVFDREIWNRLVEPHCVVINLAYSDTSATSAAVDAMAQMVEACAVAKISHLIHCSSVSVYGRADETMLNEQSLCNPLDEYGTVKLRLEQLLIERVQGRFPLTILRPSSVFGKGGISLVKLVNNLKYGSRTLNYLKSSLFGLRQSHLVPVETVVAALRFICDVEQPAGVELFIVSDDEDPINNFHDVEHILMEELEIQPYLVRPMPMPRLLLETLMRLIGRVNVNTRTVYCCDKLTSRGFVKPVTLKIALQKFATNYKT